MTTHVRLLVGAYTDRPGPGPTGLVPVVHADGALRPDGLPLDLPSPSYLVAHPRLPIAYTITETQEPSLVALRLDQQTEVAAVVDIPGAYPCHLALSADLRHVAVASYGNGTITAVRLDEAGLPRQVTATLATSGSGPHDRQDGPHAHHVLSGPDGDIWVTDLGADLVRRIRIGGTGTLRELRPAIRLPPGTGPRQTRIAADSRTAYTLGELSGELITSVDGRILHRRASSITEPTTTNYPAHLMIRGGRLYVSHRGLDRIAVFDISDGQPQPLAEHRTLRGPRHFAIAGGWLYNANENDDRVTAQRLEPPYERMAAAVTRPACVLIYGPRTT